MNHAIDQIEAGVDRTRASVESGVRAVQHKVEAVADWQGHFRARPWTVLAAAGVCGFVAGATLKPPANASGQSMAQIPGARQLAPLLDDIAEALVSVATAGMKGVIDNLIPGFSDHLARIEGRANRR